MTLHPPRLQLKKWQRWTAYGVFAFVAFVFALRETFPATAVKERLVIEAAAQGWQLSVADVRPAGLVGVGMTGVSLESRSGVRIPLDRVDATLRLWPLLLGRRGVTFDARLFDGRVKGFAEQSGATRRVVANVSGVDLSRAVPLRRATGVDLAGVLHGDVDVALDDRQPARSTGRLDLAIDGAAINGGDLPVPGMGGTLTLPKVGLGQVTAKASVKDGKFTFERLQAHGADVEASGDGLYCVVQPRLAFAPIFGKARFKIQDAFWTKASSAGFKGIVDLALAPARGADGSYGFQIFGTLSRPQARMSP